MPFLRKTWLQITAFLGQLPQDTKFLILALVVILGLAAFLMLRWAGTPDMVPLEGIAAGREAVVLQRLKSMGIEARADGTAIVVPEDEELAAIAVLARHQDLSPDTSAAFDKMLRDRSPWTSHQQNEDSYRLAKMKTLGVIISNWPAVQSADVLVDAPDRKGFGRTHRNPSASVNVMMIDGQRLTRSHADAIRALVSGTDADMNPEDVMVVDANTGKQFKPRLPGEIDPNEEMAHKRSLERNKRIDIEDALDFIPGVKVVVNILVDPLQKRTEKTWVYGKPPVKSEHNRKEERRNAEDSGEPGARPNTTATIDGGSTTTITEKTTDERTDFDQVPMTTQGDAVYTGRTVRKIYATIGVPRPYFVSLYKQQNAGGEAPVEEPDDTALQTIIEAQLKKVTEKIERLVAAEEPGDVLVDMIPDPLTVARLGEPRLEASGIRWVLTQDWAKPAGLGMLVLLSMGVMFFMVRKANQQPRLPTAEELAGVPPPLLAGEEDDLVGEVMEDESALAGVEIGEDEIRSRHIADQISEMIKANPAEAASLVGKWIGQFD